MKNSKVSPIPNPGEIWLVKFPDELLLKEMEISRITDKTVSFATYRFIGFDASKQDSSEGWVPGRPMSYLLSGVYLVERVK